MQKLILCHYSTDGYTYHVDYHIPFEYESKEKFCYDALVLLDEWKAINNLKGYKNNYTEYDRQCIEWFNGYDFSPYDIENFENNLYTLEEWFEKFNVKKIF